MAKHPGDYFFWADYADDQELKVCSLAAQGLWMRMLCIAARATPKGYVVINGKTPTPDILARAVGATDVAEVGRLVDELTASGVCSKDGEQRLYNRRMVREATHRARAAKNGAIGGRSSHDKQRGIFAPSGNAPSTPAEQDDEQDEQGAPEHSPELNYLTNQPTNQNKQQQESPFDWMVRATGIDPAKFRRHQAWINLPGIWLDWVRQGCDIERDIKPAMEQAIMSFKARNGGKPPDGPAYCLKAVLAARDKRLAAETKHVRFEDTGAAFDRRTWERVAEGLMLENLWQAPYGPKPGQDGCLMPADIQAKCLGKPVQVA